MGLPRINLTRKQAGAIAALVVALFTGALYNTQGDDNKNSSRNTSATNAPQNRDKHVALLRGNKQRHRKKARRERNVAGDFDYYALVLSWSPTYCATPKRKRPDRQCDSKQGRGYSFVLHGLWPQYKRGFPETCWTREKPFVHHRTIDKMLDIMPSPGLVIHEFKRHGTCSGLSPDNYYALSRKLYNTIKIPARYNRPKQQQMVSPSDLKEEFIAINPGLTSDMIAISCRGSGHRLREVRICFSRNGTLLPCGRNESQKRMCSAQKMFVPPVRLSSGRGWH